MARGQRQVARGLSPALLSPDTCHLLLNLLGISDFGTHHINFCFVLLLSIPQLHQFVCKYSILDPGLHAGYGGLNGAEKGAGRDIQGFVVRAAEA